MSKHFKVRVPDINKIVKLNDLQEVTNSIPFSRDRTPTQDGLLSNEIFGITKFDRSNTFAYIDLGDWFIHPYLYKIWGKLDSKIKAIVHETDTFKINEKGEFVQDPEGNTGIKWLKANINKVKIAPRSKKKDAEVKLLNEYRDVLFVNKFIIIPPFYRDVNTNVDRIGIGEINKMYQSLMIATKSLKDSADYGFNVNGPIRGRIQESMTAIYDWFCSEPQISKKFGILQRANLNKTADYSARLVITAPTVNVEKMDDLMVDLDHCALPLAAACSVFYTFILFNMRRFFENTFNTGASYPCINKQGKVEYIEPYNWQIEFSDTVLKEELDRFAHGYSNRFRPIKIPTKENREIYMAFKGYNTTPEEYAKKEPGTAPIYNRRLTWCDVIFMCAVEASKDKTVLITRYPIDTYFNQISNKVRISSTKETEPMIVDGEFYKYYPKIREEDINTNTSNLFIDSLNICNCYLKGMTGDYDGDQVTVKGAWTDEAIDEQTKLIASKRQMIGLSGKNIRVGSNEAIQSLFNLTLILPDAKNEKPVF